MVVIVTTFAVISPLVILLMWVVYWVPSGVITLQKTISWLSTGWTHHSTDMDNQFATPLKEAAMLITALGAERDTTTDGQVGGMAAGVGKEGADLQWWTGWENTFSSCERWGWR